MDLIGSMRGAVALSVMGGGLALAQAILPPTAPTTLPRSGVNAAPTVPVVASPAAAANGPHAAEVTFAGGKLAVVANGAGLNQILGQISRRTGMKIVGGVADEPVYGKYGPGPASEILSTLLDGTGINMLLRERTAAGPGELILTRRTGGVTPPDPNAERFNQGAENEPARPQYGGPTMLPQPYPAGHMDEAGQGGTGGQGGSLAPGPRSPQDIYLDLQRLQQIKKSNATPPQ